MTLSEVINGAKLFTDETPVDSELLIFANKAIARINNECNTHFPKYVNSKDSYTAMPGNWQQDLVGNYISYGIKMKDSSLTEADRYLEEFYKAIQTFKSKLGGLLQTYAAGDEDNGINSTYVDAIGLGGVYQIDTSGAINIGFFGNNSNGGCY